MTRKIQIAGIEFEDTCEGCMYGDGDRYGDFMQHGQGSICIRCPVFCCFGAEPDEPMIHPDGYNPQFAQSWRDFFDGKIPDVVLNFEVQE